MKAARDEGKQSWIVYDTLYIDGKPVKFQEATEDELHILSWNVHGLTKDNKDDPQFLQTVTTVT